MVDNQIELIDLGRGQVDTVPSVPVDSVALSPDGTEVAANEEGGTSVVTGDFVGSRGLFVVDADTGASRRLTRGDDRDPAWSPDGKWLAFTRGEGQPPLKGQGLYVIRSDGTGLRLVKSGFVSKPAWSPDGKRIAFDYWVQSGWDSLNQDWRRTTASLAVIAPSGNGLRRLTTHSWTAAKVDADDTAPMWSPDGSWIAFERTIGAGDNDGSFVYIIDPAGSNIRRVTPSGYFAETTGWSPDSGKLASWRSKICVACSAGLGPQQAWMTAVASGTSLSIGDYSSVTWSPAGELVAFGCSAATSSVCLINADGTVAERLAGTSPSTSSSSQKIQGIIVNGETSIAGKAHTYDIAALATNSRTGEPVHGVRIVKVFKASIGVATQVGATSIRYTAPKGIGKGTVRVRFVATYPGGSAPVPGLLMLIVLKP